MFKKKFPQGSLFALLGSFKIDTQGNLLGKNWWLWVTRDIKILDLCSGNY
jgi:hypothetical protein